MMRKTDENEVRTTSWQDDDGRPTSNAEEEAEDEDGVGPLSLRVLHYNVQYGEQQLQTAHSNLK